MSTDPWSRLRAPFPAAAVAWHAVACRDDGASLRLAPHLAADALRERLDAAAGPDGWSLRLAPWGTDGLIAELTVLGATRSGAARLAPDANDPVHGATATAAAWTVAAHGFGVHLPLAVVDEGWVEANPESGEPLHLPEVTAHDPRPAPDADPRAQMPAAEAPAADAPADATTAEASPAEPAPKPEAQQVIDRLMERLRAEGHGAEAAKLVTLHGGYGRDAESSRELYAKLRALLIERSAAS